MAAKWESTLHVSCADWSNVSCLFWVNISLYLKHKSRACCLPNLFCTSRFHVLLMKSTQQNNREHLCIEIILFCKTSALHFHYQKEIVLLTFFLHHYHCYLPSKCFTITSALTIAFSSKLPSKGITCSYFP